MSKYQELVKSFDNIRKLAQDFYIYGYNGRGDFPFMSERMYDNELRRVKSYLKNYVKTVKQKDKKTVAITSESVSKTVNPLFLLFSGKSFTNVDCFLHFVLIDILCDHKERTLNEITDEIYNNYDFDVIDTMTIRHKLFEYGELGIVKINKKGNRNYFSLQDSIVFDEDLIEAIVFFQNILPAGYIVSPLVEGYKSIFLYKQIFFSNVLDDEYILALLKAIERKASIRIKQKSHRHDVFRSGVPLRIIHNMITGRRYVKVKQKTNNCVDVRIDKIEAIYIDEETVNNDITVNEEKMRYLKVTVSVSDDEKFIIDRMNREIGEEQIEKIEDNIYCFTLYAKELLDVVPYVRTYFGRIISLESDNDYIIKKLRKDLGLTIDLYEEGE